MAIIMRYNDCHDNKSWQSNVVVVESRIAKKDCGNEIFNILLFFIVVPCRSFVARALSSRNIKSTMAW